MTNKLYKVLCRINGKLLSPFQGYEYEPYKEYVCADFNPNPEEDCSCGYYATGIEGIIYSFRNLPCDEVWEVEVGGKRVEIDRFKRRYERIKLIRQVPLEEVKRLAETEEEKVGYKLSEVLFPINPLKIKAGPVTDKEIELLKKWRSVRGNVRGSIGDSIRDSIWDNVGRRVGDSVWSSIWDNVGRCVGDSVWSSIWDNVGRYVGGSVWDSVWGRGSAWDSLSGSIEDSVWDSVGAYISSLYPNIEKWKDINHSEGENPFQPCIDLWRKGFVPSFDGKTWRLHAGENAEIVWGGEIWSSQTKE